MAGVGPERQVVHSAAVVVRLRGARHHGHARDRKSPRPAGDDPHRAADELLGPAAGVRDSDRRVRAGSAITWAAWSGCKGLTLLGDVFGRRDRGDRRGLAAEEDAAPRRDAAVRDGAAQLQDAVAADGRLSHGRARLGVCGPGRHGDFRRHDRRLGAGLLSAVRTSAWPPTSPPSGPSCDRRRRPGRVRRTRTTWTTSKPACISGTASWAGPGSGSSRPCGRSAGIGGSAARRSPRFRPAKS